MVSFFIPFVLDSIVTDWCTKKRSTLRRRFYKANRALGIFEFIPDFLTFRLQFKW